MKMKLFIFTLLVGYAICKSPEEGSMIEGDMELDPDQMSAYMEQRERSGNTFAAIKSNLWLTNGKADTIKYYIDYRISRATKAINQALADYEKYTCLRFSKQTGRPSGPHIFFTTGSGCTSPVGRMRHGNSIRLAGGCWTKGIVIHEIGHTIGLFHEQSRPDRDQYVKILYENIQDRYKFAFNKMRVSNWDAKGTKYDLDSIMHYGQRYFSKNRQLTIKALKSSDQGRIGQRRGFSEIDKQQINKMYCGGNGGSGGSGGGTECVDKHKNCPYWAAMYCISNQYVKENCKKSCKTC
ncbi:zinc metalloproteinase dpy-31-like isoform X1 [Clytia hemisphaerica]|uniref:Metalloendopeptidase n=1 Tax=Clytia hemisphaerica TaxID=252671 RepID=A0A7M5ULP9_9CNID